MERCRGTKVLVVHLDGRPLIEDVFDDIVDIGHDELVVVAGPMTESIFERDGDRSEGGQIVSEAP